MSWVHTQNHYNTLKINSTTSLLLLKGDKANLFVRVTPCPSCSEQSSIHVRTLPDVMKRLESEGDAKQETERKTDIITDNERVNTCLFVFLRNE